MRVGFDISQVAHQGGVVSYTQNLVRRLVNIKDLEMVFFYSSLRKVYKGDLPNVKSFPIPPTIFEPLFNSLRIIPIESFIGQIDVFHSSDWTQPRAKAKKVTTYHDVVPLKYPQWSHPKIAAVAKRRLEIVEKEVDCVIAVSESTKRDLLELTNIPKERITVIYEAAADYFKPQEENEINGFKKEFNLPKEFVLAIGGVGERRNLKRVKEADKKYNLVITGETIPYVTEKQMPLLYASAKVLLYPSLYEGFGLPILEAMATGTPVITSNVSSMPEVGGKAAEYVNPESVIDIENKLRQVMEDEKRREKMIKLGFEQAKKFSWEKCAKETVEVYRNLMGKPKVST